MAKKTQRRSWVNFIFDFFTPICKVIGLYVVFSCCEINNMKKILLLSYLILSQLSVFAQSFEKNEFVVMLKPGFTANDFVKTMNSKGYLGQFYLKSVATEEWRIYVIGMDEVLGEPNRFVQEANDLTMVIAAQLNYHVTQRATPNDASFNQQWGLHNTGQNGGTVDADIDAPEAWDITTGGVTAAGDTIVIAVVDGGMQLNHPDLLGNYFINYNEIPNNGIDDDGNGYIDDYRGWNAYNNNGNVPSDQHGTHVGGIIGARGNNNTGVSGVNWRVKIMPIGGSSGNFSIVVNAYSYAAKMRKLYNQTNGAQGAFVVATNASFGVDYGQASNFPVWCAFYDTLGTLGILSMGAGPNANTNIDVQGDIPTTCPSNYLVAVTNSTRQDVKNTQAGYGTTHMDIAAPGSSIYNTVSGSGYNSLSGTSMATPMVTGVVALMYAAACEQFIIDYKSNPSLMALQMRSWLLSSVDVKSNFASQVGSGGRLNAHKALLAVQTYDCTPTILPNASFSANNTEGCAPLTVQYTNSSTGTNLTYAWTFPGGTPATSNIAAPSVTYNTAGNYTATLTVSNSGGTDVFQTNITVNANTTAPTITQNGSVLTASSGSTFQWYINGDPIPGATGQSYTISQNGAYTVVATDANGCVSQTSAPVNAFLGLQENNLLVTHVYPNPTQDFITIEWNNSNRAQIKLLDMLGRVLSVYSQIESGQTLNLSNLATGMYWVEIDIDNEKRSFKILKK